MTPEFVEAWEVVAYAMAERHESGRIGGIKTALAAFFDDGAPWLRDADHWPAASRRELMRTVVPDASCQVHEGPHDRSTVDAARCLLDAHHLVSAQPRGVERDLLDGVAAVRVPQVVKGGGAFLARELRSRVAVPRVTSGNDVEVVSFAHAWRRRADRRGTLRLGSAEAGLLHVDARDAPMVVSLTHREGRLDVRRYGTAWIRPVMLPWTWTPACVGAFVDAATGAVPWNDSPFHENPRGGTAVFAPCEVAEPGEGVPDPDGAREREARACMLRAGPLFVVDGIVHRTTSEPRLSIAIPGRSLRHGPWRAVWTLDGDLDSTQVMTTWRSRSGRSWWWMAERGSGRPGPGHGLPYEATDILSHVVERVNREHADRAKGSPPWSASLMSECVTDAGHIAEGPPPSDPDPRAKRLLGTLAAELGRVSATVPPTAAADRREWLDVTMRAVGWAIGALGRGNATQARGTLSRCTTMPASGNPSVAFSYADALTRVIVPEVTAALSEEPDLSDLVF